MESLIAGIAIAIIGGIAAGVNSYVNDKRAKNQAEQDRDYIAEMYEINKERAEEEFEQFCIGWR